MNAAILTDWVLRRTLSNHDQLSLQRRVCEFIAE